MRLQAILKHLFVKAIKWLFANRQKIRKHAKGIVKREVVKIITPGTMTEGKTIDANTNHFIGSADSIDGNKYALAYLDLATGEGKVECVEGDERTLIAEIEALGMKEVVVDERLHLALSDSMAKRNIMLSIEYGEEQFETKDLFAAVPLDVTEACSMLVSYVKRTQKTALDHIRPFEFIPKTSETIHRCQFNAQSGTCSINSQWKQRKARFTGLLDETVTAMGARKLKMWIHQPLAEKSMKLKIGSIP